MTEGPRVNFVMREALFEIYTWILCLSYLHEKQTSRIQSLNEAGFLSLHFFAYLRKMLYEVELSVFVSLLQYNLDNLLLIYYTCFQRLSLISILPSPPMHPFPIHQMHDS